MRVLFLDIDGVLQSTRTALVSGGYATAKTYREQRDRLDWTAIALLRGLCAAGGIAVVLSSTWRIGLSREEVLALGVFLGLPIIGATPYGWAERGLEIQAWLDAHAETEDYAIIDDDADMLASQLPRFVHVSSADGLTWKPFEHLCGLFGISPFDCSASAPRAALPAGSARQESAPRMAAMGQGVQFED